MWCNVFVDNKYTETSMITLNVPTQMYQTLQLDSNQCRNFYGLVYVGGDKFSATAEGWRKAIDSYRHFGWELPEDVVEGFAQRVEAMLDHSHA
jgi:hypothetical protein